MGLNPPNIFKISGIQLKVKFGVVKGSRGKETVLKPTFQAKWDRRLMMDEQMKRRVVSVSV